MFTGANDYELRQAVRRWKREFLLKHGAENLLELSGSTSTLSEILDAVATMPFIAEKRLVVVDGLPKLEKEDIARLDTSIHPQTVLLLLAGTLDQRLGSTKALMKCAVVKQFPCREASDIASWIIDQCRSRGIDCPSDVAHALLARCGNNQWILETEIEKLSLFVEGRALTVHDVRALAVPAGEEEIWDLTDLIAAGKTSDALLSLRARADRGENVYGMWAPLLSVVRQMGLMAAAMSDGCSQAAQIAERTAIHPFPVRKLLPLVRSLGMQRVRACIEFAADADIGLKSGAYHASTSRPSEQLALIESLIVRCCPAKA